MNLLVYLGLRQCDLPKARADLAEKSKAISLKEWLGRGHVQGNYCADTGQGCNKQNSGANYHWGGLLGMIALIEAGRIEGTEKPITLNTGEGQANDIRAWNGQLDSTIRRGVSDRLEWTEPRWPT